MNERFSMRAWRHTAMVAAAVGTLSGCGLAPNTPPGHDATVRGAVQAFLLGCGTDSAPLVFEQLNVPAQRLFGEARGTLGGCQAVLPLEPGRAPTKDLFANADVGRVVVHGDRAEAVVRSPEGDVTRAELESSPPGDWRLRPSSTR